MEIILKNSGTLGLIPDESELNYGELAINYASGSEGLFIKNENDSIICISKDHGNYVDAIIDSTPTASMSDGTFFNTNTNRVEVWKHTSVDNIEMVESYTLKKNEVIYNDDIDNFNVWNGSSLQTLNLSNGIGRATASTLGLVKGGGNVEIDNNGTMSIDMSDYATTASVNTAISDNNDNVLKMGSILHYHRLDWLEASPQYLFMYRYTSLRDSVIDIPESSSGHHTKIFVKDGIPACHIELGSDSKTITVVYIKLSGDDVLKTIYTLTPDNDYYPGERINELNNNGRLCTVVKTETVDNNRVLNYANLDLSAQSYGGQLTDDVNGHNGLFKAFELLPSGSSFVYDDYTPLHRPTLTVQYVGADGEKHIVTYTSFYAKSITINNTACAICVAEGVSSVFAWVFSDGSYKWKFAFGNNYTDVEGRLQQTISNSSGTQPVEPEISGGGDIPGQSGQGEVRP